MEELVLTSLREGVLTITINRAEARNALNASVVKNLIKSFTAASKDKKVRVVILRGAGESAFCAGADLKELNDAPPAGKRAFFASIAILLTAMAKCPKPIIAAVHGFALAGGCGLAAAADLTLAADDAIFGLPEIHIGLVPMIVMLPLHRAIGRKALSHLVLSGQNIDATEAKEIRLISKVYPKASLEREVETLAASLAKKSPVALAAAKKGLLDVGEGNYLTLLKSFADRVGTLSGSPDTKEGIAAFLEKRVPNWPSTKK